MRPDHVPTLTCTPTCTHPHAHTHIQTHMRTHTSLHTCTHTYMHSHSYGHAPPHHHHHLHGSIEPHSSVVGAAPLTLGPTPQATSHHNPICKLFNLILMLSIWPLAPVVSVLSATKRHDRPLRRPQHLRSTFCRHGQENSRFLLTIFLVFIFFMLLEMSIHTRYS